MATNHDHENQADDADEISKKEVLTITGISYGQFYRWKRMGLIPEEWFHRRSSFTGQETYLPRRRVLERIGQIMALRERFSLEEIVEQLSPDASRRRYTRDDLARMPWVTTAALQLFPGDTTDDFNINDLLCLAMIEHIRLLPDITLADVRLAAETLLARSADMDGKDTEWSLSLLRKDGIDFVVLHNGRCLLDPTTRNCFTLDINRLFDEVMGHLRTMAE